MRKLLWYWRQSKVYALSKRRVLKVGRGVTSYPSLSKRGILPRVYKRGRWYMIEERVKTYWEMSFAERKLIRRVESDFSREVSYIRKNTPWYKRIFWVYNVNRKHARPLFEKWWWGALLGFKLSNFHFWDVKRRNLGIRRGKPVLIDEGVVKYKK